MQKGDVFKSKYLRGDDIGEAEVAVIIADVVPEIVVEGEDPKPVMYFKGKEKGMVINSGNWDALAYAYGDESDNWKGKSAVIYTIIGTFQGKTGHWLRIKAKKAAKRVESENPGAELDDEIPF